jgi:Ribbon-helix-helix protein, copG family
MEHKDVKTLLNIVVPVKLMAELDAEARQEGLTRSAHVRRIIAARHQLKGLTAFGKAIKEIEAVNGGDTGSTVRGHR